MTKVLLFKVEVKGLENKIWRDIEITDRRTVADLAYTILASFDAFADHLYKITYKDKIYDCYLACEDNLDGELPINAVETKLSTIGLKFNDMLEMEYDFGSPTIFNIIYLGARDFEKYNGMHYPRVVEGAGRGIINDIANDELKAVVTDIDDRFFSDYVYLPSSGVYRPYDYRNFDVTKNNLNIRRYFWKIKRGYE
mgnify:FL=1